MHYHYYSYKQYMNATFDCCPPNLAFNCWICAASIFLNSGSGYSKQNRQCRAHTWHFTQDNRIIKQIQYTFTSHLDVHDLLIVTFLLFLPVLNHLMPLEPFVHFRLIIGILSLGISAHLTILSLFSPALNLTFSLLPITSSHPHARASDSTFDFWCYIDIWLTLTLHSFHVFVVITDTLNLISLITHKDSRLEVYHINTACTCFPYNFNACHRLNSVESHKQNKHREREINKKSLLNLLRTGSVKALNGPDLGNCKAY